MMAQRTKVVLLDDWERTAARSSAVRALSENPRVELVQYRDSASGDELAERIADAEVIILIRERSAIDREVLSAAPRLRLIAQTGTGIAHIDAAAAERRGIRIATTPGASTGAVAELTMGLMIALLRGIASADAIVRIGGWDAPYGRELAGRRLGLVGYGRIARRVAELANAFGMVVHTWTPTFRERPGAVAHRTLEELLAQSEVASVHVPLNRNTAGLIDRDRIALMPAESFLVNTARSAIVPEAGILAGLDDGQLAAAALDVFDEEPLAPDSALRRHPRVLLSPHAGWRTAETYERFYEGAVEHVNAHVETAHAG